MHGVKVHIGILACIIFQKLIADNIRAALIGIIRDIADAGCHENIAVPVNPLRTLSEEAHQRLPAS